MNIIFADISGAFQYILPVIPETLGVKTGENNETIETLSGFIRLTGSKNLKEVNWESFFPVYKNYPFQVFGSDSDGWNYVNFFESITSQNIPCRLIITETKKRLPIQRTIINSLVTVDTFDYSTDKVGDIKYSISMTEFPSDKWDFLSMSLKNLQQFSGVTAQSIARQKLIQNGLL